MWKLAYRNKVSEQRLQYSFTYPDEKLQYKIFALDTSSSIGEVPTFKVGELGLSPAGLGFLYNFTAITWIDGIIIVLSLH